MSPRVSQSPSPTAPTTNAASTGSVTAPVTETMFLQLLVAQLQNQDPSNPSDSTQFVTQLSQFQTMEQSMNQGTTMASMLTDLNQLVAAIPTATTTSTPTTPAT
jgi:flagellar basal-body rod modification protein FlgD